MIIKIKILLTNLLVVASLISIAQGVQPINDSSVSRYQITSNDSMVYRLLEEVDVFPQKGRNLSYRRYTRIVAKIRKVYPFAISASEELAKYNEKYEKSTSQREKRKYVNKVEKELFKKHEDELKRLTISEGQYLMLLIDRETGQHSYSIIKELKGGVPALFWQGIAKIFNNDLKKEYDPIYNHYMIEQIVLMIEKENAEAEKKKKTTSLSPGNNSTKYK